MQRSCSKPSPQYGFTTFFLPFFFLNSAIPRCYSKILENRVHPFEKNKKKKKKQKKTKLDGIRENVNVKIMLGQ